MSSKAAVILSILNKAPNQEQVSIEAKDFKELFIGFSPDKICVDNVTKEPKFVLVNRLNAIRYLQSRHGLRSVRRDTT